MAFVGEVVGPYGPLLLLVGRSDFAWKAYRTPEVIVDRLLRAFQRGSARRH